MGPAPAVASEATCTSQQTGRPRPDRPIPPRHRLLSTRFSAPVSLRRVTARPYHQGHDPARCPRRLSLGQAASTTPTGEGLSGEGLSINRLPRVIGCPTTPPGPRPSAPKPVCTEGPPADRFCGDPRHPTRFPHARGFFTPCPRWPRWARRRSGPISSRRSPSRSRRPHASSRASQREDGAGARGPSDRRCLQPLPSLPR